MSVWWPLNGTLHPHPSEPDFEEEGSGENDTHRRTPYLVLLSLNEGEVVGWAGGGG